MRLDLPQEVKTIGDLRLELAKHSPGWDEIFAPQQNMRAAQHQVMVESTTLLEDNAEIAFFPPVTGG
jgi:molybdopterin synthase sulfur carrier subunit